MIATNRSRDAQMLDADQGCTHLISKMVFLGFIAAWFLADSPIRRSLSVKDTKDGVVKEPCSLATVEH